MHPSIGLPNHTHYQVPRLHRYWISRFQDCKWSCKFIIPSIPQSKCSQTTVYIRNPTPGPQQFASLMKMLPAYCGQQENNAPFSQVPCCFTFKQHLNLSRAWKKVTASSSPSSKAWDWHENVGSNLHRN